jgi:hypothetical protein
MVMHGPSEVNPPHLSSRGLGRPRSRSRYPALACGADLSLVCLFLQGASCEIMNPCKHKLSVIQMTRALVPYASTLLRWSEVLSPSMQPLRTCQASFGKWMHRRVDFKEVQCSRLIDILTAFRHAALFSRARNLTYYLTSSRAMCRGCPNQGVTFVSILQALPAISCHHSSF